MEGMQVAALTELVAPFHQFAVQQGHLTGGAAEAHQSEPEPEAAGFRQGWGPAMGGGAAG